MKKALCIILTVLLVLLSLAGCGKAKDADTTSKDKAKTTDNVEINSTDENTDSASENELGFNTEVYRVPITEIYINLPNSPYHLVELGYTKAAFIYDQQCISITGNKESTATTLEKAQEDNIKEYGLSFNNDFKFDSLTVKEDEYVTINGIEMYRFEGEFNCYYETLYKDRTEKTTYTQYAVGYTFIMDGIPCSFIGVVLDEEQSQSVIKDVEEKVDALIKTLKSEP